MPRDRGLGAGRRGHTHGHADPQAVTERPRVVLHAQASPPLVVVTATINGSLQNGHRHGGECRGSPVEGSYPVRPRRVKDDRSAMSPSRTSAPPAAECYWSGDSRDRRRAGRCSTAAVPYVATTRRGLRPAGPGRVEHAGDGGPARGAGQRRRDGTLLAQVTDIPVGGGKVPRPRRSLLPSWREGVQGLQRHLHPRRLRLQSGR